MSNAISVNQLTFTYPNQSQATLQIENWHVEKNQKVFLHGPSGTGKSTLLNVLSGILTPSSGELTILGNAIGKLSAGKRDKFRANHLGYVFQQFNLIPYLSVLDNLNLARRFASNKKPKMSNQALLADLNISTDLHKKPVQQLSIGQQQRVAIARALVNQPELIIVDEPTSALDQQNSDRFMQVLLEQVNNTQSTLVFVSHDWRLAERFDQAVALADINSAGRA
ncbi:ABC transporter ATP-binding protein [Catenovulum sp. SM1970]|uniref:ABC transporter ATP-binding protein n=1 Tax=Marinifaba aquimaris TaxID=2741323 RepID=UPI001574E2CF|nr:ABC transporter ATP-binding protein [Marinifaba aquimaris]NTS78201.1 ABC transporter ATP-binding protein [Marinifaba aquimaris]